MSSETLVSPQPGGATPAALRDGTGSGHANFGRLLVGEWTKLRSVRSTYWSITILMVIYLLLCWLIPDLDRLNWSKAPGNGANPTSLTVTQDPVSAIDEAGLGLGQLAVSVLGVLVITSEYGTGMIRSTLLATPKRWRMLAAKGLVFGALMLVIGETLGFVGYFIGAITLHSVIHISLSDPDAMRQVVGVGLYLGMLGLFSMSVGLLIRHSAGAITAVLAFILLVSGLIRLIPDNVGNYIYTYEPAIGGFMLTERNIPSYFYLSSWEGYGIFAAWTALFLLLGGWLLQRRDA